MISSQVRAAYAIALSLIGASLGAQQRDSSANAPMSVISGTVYDSVARAPLRGAIVQRVSADNPGLSSATTLTDSAGRFSLPPVAAGDYLVGFLHPMLDSLGIEPRVYRVSVRAGAPASVALAVPSPQRIHAAICGARPKGDSSGAIIGHLIDAESGTTAAAGKVIVRWMELTIGRGGVGRSFPVLQDTTRDGGWFAICDVPLLSDVSLQAVRGTDSTAELMVEVPATRLLRRDLYIGASEVTLLPSPDSAQVPDSLRLPPTYVHRGTSRLQGTILRAGTNAPLGGARVTIVGSGVVATSDERGSFTLAGLPGGTQMLDARAVGYLPERRVVDLIAGKAPALTISLSTLKSVLDTIRVTAKRVYSADSRGFERRRRMGFGTFFGSEDVERLRPFNTTSLLNRVPSVRIVGSVATSERILMRGTLGYCSPDLYLDGMRLTNMDARDIDSWVQPDEIEGMEVYTSAGRVPPEFSSLSGCGSIVIWTRRSPRPKP
jgi:hypothetical protein